MYTKYKEVSLSYISNKFNKKKKKKERCKLPYENPSNFK